MPFSLALFSPLTKTRRKGKKEGKKEGKKKRKRKKERLLSKNFQNPIWFGCWLRKQTRSQPFCTHLSSPDTYTCDCMLASTMAVDRRGKKRRREKEKGSFFLSLSFSLFSLSSLSFFFSFLSSLLSPSFFSRLFFLFRISSA